MTWPDMSVICALLDDADSGKQSGSRRPLLHRNRAAALYSIIARDGYSDRFGLLMRPRYATGPHPFVTLQGCTSEILTWS